MKPEDLLDAIQGIPEDYIAEAKPKRHRDPRRSLHSAEQSAAAPSAENIRESSGSPASGAVQHTPKHRREEPDMTQKHFSLHRLTTGIAAAAACAVFIGGGVFIAKQAADRDRSDGGTDGQIKIQREGGAEAVDPRAEIRRGGGHADMKTHTFSSSIIQ